MQVEKEFDFVTGTVEKIHKKVNEKSYKKIAFFAITLSLGLTLGNIIYHETSNYFKVSAVESTQIRETYLKKIKSIKPEDISKAIQYHKDMMNIYDSSYEILNDRVKINSGVGKDFSLNDLDMTRKYINSYKEKIAENIVNFEKNMVSFDKLSNDDLEKLVLFYAKYENNSFTPDLKVETEFDKFFHLSGDRNRDLVQSGIMKKYTDLKNEMRLKMQNKQEEKTNTIGNKL